jgi:NADPH:quinone reductase-like Zn-dependent oxidoreductase
VLLGLLAERKISPRIALRLPLDRAREANERIEAGGLDGKIVLLAAEDQAPGGSSRILGA